MVEIRQIDSSQHKESHWSGGKTTELYLFPPSGDYQQRDFSYRLSTASVELAESDFTPLAGVHRLLMSLDRPIQLTHKRTQEKINIAPFEVYSFDGGDAIQSKGQCQDFNVMYKSPYTAELAAITSACSIRKTERDQFIYALSDLQYQVNGRSGQLVANHLLQLIRQPDEQEIKIRLESQEASAQPVAIWVGIASHTN